jgi:hypothetical protein
VIMTTVTTGENRRVDERLTPDWRRANWSNMRSELRSVHWKRRMEGKSTEEAWTLFKTKVESLIERWVPVRRNRNRNRPEWMSVEILREVRRKKRLWKKVRTGQITAEYKEVEKRVRTMIRTAKRNFEKKLAAGNKGNKRPFFAYIKRKTKTRSTIGPLKDEAGRTVTEDVDMAGLLNRTFQAVFTREPAGEVPAPSEARAEREIENVKFNFRTVKRKIKELRSDAAAGPDGIGPRVLQELVDGLAPALVIIFTKSMETGEVPMEWREANVTPIFKKGAKSCPGNYRPVSLTSVCCKVMESVVRDAVTDHLKANNLIKKSQHGFVKGRSCATNLLEFLEKATIAIDRGESFDVVYLDFAKAFDKVPHKRLAKKLRAHGIKGRVLKWVKSWLTNTNTCGTERKILFMGRRTVWRSTGQRPGPTPVCNFHQ